MFTFVLVVLVLVGAYAAIMNPRVTAKVMDYAYTAYVWIKSNIVLPLIPRLHYIGTIGWELTKGLIHGIWGLVKIGWLVIRFMGEFLLLNITLADWWLIASMIFVGSLYGVVIQLVRVVWWQVTVLEILAIIAFTVNAVVVVNPPFVGVMTVLGRYAGRTRSGVFFAPIRGWLTEVFTFDSSYVEAKVEIDNVITPDKIKGKVAVGYRLELDENEIESFNRNEQFTGAKKAIERDIKTVLREWAKDDTNEPKTFEKLITMADEATVSLINGVTGDNVTGNATEISNYRTGKAKKKIPHYGVILRKLDVTEVIPPEQIPNAALKFEVEKKERIANVEEAEGVVDTAARYAEFLAATPGNPTSEEKEKALGTAVFVQVAEDDRAKHVHSVNANPATVANFKPVNVKIGGA